jgi:hypothetical protein
LTIRGPLEPDEIKPNFIYREANWELFENYLVNNLNTQCLEGNCSKSEIGVAVKRLTDTINRASLYAIPLNRRTFRLMQIETSTRVLIQNRNKLRTQWQKTHVISVRPLSNSFKEQIDSAITEQLWSAWQKTLQGLDTNSTRDTWRITESLTNTNSNIPPLTISGKTATAIQENVNASADILEQIFITNSDTDRTFTFSTEQVVNYFLKEPLTDKLRATNHSEIAWIVRHLKLRRQLGLTGCRI